MNTANSFFQPILTFKKNVCKKTSKKERVVLMSPYHNCPVAWKSSGEEKVWKHFWHCQLPTGFAWSDNLKINYVKKLEKREFVNNKKYYFKMIIGLIRLIANLYSFAVQIILTKS